MDYLTEIDQTDQCQVQFKRNTSDEWILGLSFLNSYTTDFKIDSTKNYFAITASDNEKPWTSTTAPLLTYNENETVPVANIAL